MKSSESNGGKGGSAFLLVGFNGYRADLFFYVTYIFN
jgi:hypothetical protein